MKQDLKEHHRNPGWLSIAIVLGAELLKSISGSVLSFVQKPAPPFPLLDGERAKLLSARDEDSPKTNVDRSLRSGTALVAVCMAISVLSGLAFLFCFWTETRDWRLGGSLALWLAAFGAALVFYAHRLIAYREAIEERHDLPSSEDEREATVEDFCAAANDARRRSLLKWMVGASAVVFSGMGISVFRSFGMNPSAVLYDTIWKRGQRIVTEEHEPITIESLQPGSAISVFPEDKIGSERAHTILIRVEEQFLQLPSQRSNWAPAGFIAYSRVCTHAGCPVGMFESTTNLLLCPCHQSAFDVLRAAEPTSGPAVRALPQLPLYIDSEGNLRAGGGFSAPPGPGFWGMP